jgi:hypothetical protein
MSVIGRLDGQVDDVLISPISKSRAPERKVPRDEQTGNAPDETARESVTTENERTDERPTLPVWLL